MSKLVAGGVLLSAVLYISTCSFISHREAKGFGAINVGDSEREVMHLLGNPSLREHAGAGPFIRYTSYACVAPCSERLWYENHLSIFGEAWSVDLNDDRRVIKKVRWVSP